MARSGHFQVEDRDFTLQMVSPLETTLLSAQDPDFLFWVQRTLLPKTHAYRVSNYFIFTFWHLACGHLTSVAF